MRYASPIQAVPDAARNVRRSYAPRQPVNADMINMILGDLGGYQRCDTVIQRLLLDERSPTGRFAMLHSVHRITAVSPLLSKSICRLFSSSSIIVVVGLHVVRSQNSVV